MPPELTSPLCLLPSFTVTMSLQTDQAIYTTGLCTLMVYYAHFGKRLRYSHAGTDCKPFTLCT